MATGYDSKRLSISVTLRDGDRAARAGEPLFSNPHVGDTAKHWRKMWIREHRRTCDGCAWCAVLDTPPHCR